MPLSRTETILGFVQKSKETFFDAELALEHQRYENAQNRIYYGIFHMITALAYIDNFVTSKHQTLMGWFNKKYVHDAKIFSVESYSIYKDAYRNRQGADYSIYIKFTKEEISDSLRKSKRFTASLERYIQERLMTTE